MRISGIRVNVAEEDQVLDMVEQTIKDFGRLDILVNNAGMRLAKLPQNCETTCCVNFFRKDLRNQLL